MFERNNRVYYERRAEETTKLGDRTTDPKVAAVHYELALRYAILAFQQSHAGSNVLDFTGERRNAPSSELSVISGRTLATELQQALERG